MSETINSLEDLGTATDTVASDAPVYTQDRKSVV